MTGDETTSGADPWVERLSNEVSGAEQPVDAALVNFVTHAPMEPAVRNELINRLYGRMAHELDGLLYERAADADEPHVANFFNFAHWASAYVGSFIRKSSPVASKPLEDGNAVVFQSMARAFLEFRATCEMAVPGTGDHNIEDIAESVSNKLARDVPRASRVNASVQPLVKLGVGTVVESLIDPEHGLPPAVLDHVRWDPRSQGVGDLLEAIRDEGLACYHQARSATTEVTRRRCILQGNAWLVISEQAMVDAALTQAVRSKIRRKTSPRLLEPHRKWRSRVPSSRQLQLENASIGGFSRLLKWSTPEGVLPDAPRRKGQLLLGKWFVEHRDAALARMSELGAPFTLFDCPESCSFWTSLQQRIPLIYAIMVSSEHDDWFDDLGHPKLAPAWTAFESAGRLLLAEMREQSDEVPTAPAARPDFDDVVGFDAATGQRQRANDWLTASRLFTRDREMVLAALFARSLLATYTSAPGAAVLDLRAHNIGPERTDRRVTMSGDSLPRLRRTTRFVEAMFADGSVPGGSYRAGALTASAHVNDEVKSKDHWLDEVAAVHAHLQEVIREGMAAPEVPDPALFEAAIGAEQLVGACVSFVVPVVRTLEECYGREWTTAERDAWARVWVEITYRQGLEPALANPASARDREVVEALGWLDRDPSSFTYADLDYAHWLIRSRNMHRSLSGVRLADNLRRDLEDGVPTVWRPTIKIGIEVFGDAQVNRTLMMPRSRWTSLARRLKFSDAATRVVNRWFIRMVLRELYRVQPEPAWDRCFPPGRAIREPQLS